MSEPKLVTVGGMTFIIFPDDERVSEEEKRKKSEIIRNAQEAINGGQITGIISK